MLPHPTKRRIGPRFAIGDDRLLGQPALDIGSQFERRTVAPAGVVSHRLFTDSSQAVRYLRIGVPGRNQTSFSDSLQNVAALQAARRLPRENRVENCAEAIDIAQRSYYCRLARRLLRTHISGRADDFAGRRYALPLGRDPAAGPLRSPIERRFALIDAKRLRQAPIDH